jgi:phosphoenolpyruvate carboxykinase (ATP)
VNTGWSGGSFGTGKRMKLSVTRALIDAIHGDALQQAPTRRDPIFGFEVITSAPGVPEGILIPRDTWQNPRAYDEKAARLAGLFIENFKRFSEHVAPEVREAGPVPGAMSVA